MRPADLILGLVVLGATGAAVYFGTRQPGATQSSAGTFGHVGPAYAPPQTQKVAPPPQAPPVNVGSINVNDIIKTGQDLFAFGKGAADFFGKLF